jgi:hypothetical protein
LPRPKAAVSARAMLRISKYFLNVARFRKPLGGEESQDRAELLLRAGRAVLQEDREGRKRYRAGFQYCLKLLIQKPRRVVMVLLI